MTRVILQHAPVTRSLHVIAPLETEIIFMSFSWTKLRRSVRMSYIYIHSSNDFQNRVVHNELIYGVKFWGLIIYDSR